MKYIFLFIALGIGTNTFSQEFKIYENGFIYSPYAMEKLKGMVGEKNEEFRVCELNKVYLSTEQTKGKVFTLKRPDTTALKKDLINAILFDDFISKYVNTEDRALRLLTKYDFTNYKKVETIGIREQPDGNRFEIPEVSWEDSKMGHWVWDFSSMDYVKVVYLEKAFTSKKIPDRYARMIQYSECLIDTTSQIFQGNALTKRWYPRNDKSRRKQQEFLDFVNKKFGKERPHVRFDEDLTKEQVRARFDSLKHWEKSKKNFVKTALSKDAEFCRLLDEAYSEALENKNSNDEFENYVAEFLSSKQALALKRNRKVIGQCSMDSRPRVHAMNIAQLAGESLNWDIFLRAHLNVLNDNVSRVSDGSWAWEERQTYVKEIEALNINVFELLLGIAFRSENVADGHYFGSIGRLGRAVAESKDMALFEDELPLIVSDEALDDYNRLLMFYMYDHLSYNKDNSKGKFNYKADRKEAITWLPEYLRNEIDQ